MGEHWIVYPAVAGSTPVGLGLKGEIMKEMLKELVMLLTFGVMGILLASCLSFTTNPKIGIAKYGYKLINSPFVFIKFILALFYIFLLHLSLFVMFLIWLIQEGIEWKGAKSDKAAIERRGIL